VFDIADPIVNGVGEFKGSG